ncbi:hypothetical protein [Embleya sp. NBC_00896]|uniref:AbiJ-related protein n=1 Tax=Embleya sp. NBC_00896 TaxID=2975961 RepID=UPI002F910D60|nr:hypothetical protein OG928_46665 [Embleya sp. NBC_00896]
MAAERITHITRRRLRDAIGEQWCGVLDEVEFLSRLYDLDRMPSDDPRYATAAGDLWQHYINNCDYDVKWLFGNARFGLAHDDTAVLRFLAETLHPEVRTDEHEVQRLHAKFNECLAPDGYELVQVDAISDAPIFSHRTIGTGVPGNVKNLIFACNGPKPTLVFADALNNDIRIDKNAEFCLVYDNPIPAHGLTWGDLTAWWADREHTTDAPTHATDRGLRRRLQSSLAGNGAELRLLDTYMDRYDRLGPGIPALLPQIYLHYDPYTRRDHAPGTGPLRRQRMDFLLLFPGQARVVIEVDGKQHYSAADGYADPVEYAAMVAEDRELKLRGYEVYRFGGAELTDTPGNRRRLADFFDRLAARHA